MRVVIHAGAHKTGTSLVQWYFNDDPPMIRSLGISFIKRADASQLVGWGNKPPEGLQSRLAEESTKQRPVALMSLENMLGRPLLPDRPGLYPDAAQRAENLAKSCAGFDAHVVYYVRPMAEFLESFYLQTIHQGAWHSFEDWYASLSGTHSWTPVVQALDDAFGADRVILGDFSEMAAGQNQFLRQFMIRSGLPQPPTVDYKRIHNASVSARGLAIARDINPHLQSSEERYATRLFLQKNFSNQGEDRARPMPEELRRSIMEQTAAEWEALAARAAACLAAPPEPPPVPPRRPATRRRALRQRGKRLARRVRARLRG